MGNQITATAPAQILPIESYLNELTDYTKTSSLGSTRFFKVAKATYSDGSEVVVKVFAKHDTLLQLAPYEKKLHDILLKLHGVSNALPFKKFFEMDKAAFLIRQHVHYNAFDRLSTRPFLTNIERKWIVFQLLKVLGEMYDKRVCHGDIKTENVLLTSWNWVLLTDFASFKPTFLPDDNPADFSFFFDTSRRRTCYVAPERFCSPEIVHESAKKPNPLSHAMDIFSLGCVIGELFLDGRPIFDLSQLLKFNSGEDKEFMEGNLKKINDKFIRRLVRHMLQLNPGDRFNAQEYLKIYRGDIFPDSFYSFLHDYFKLFCLEQLSPDRSIQKLSSDIEAILANLIIHPHTEDRETGYGDSLVIVLNAITAHVRVAKLAVSKLAALEMIRSISRHIPDESILERVIPHVVYLLKDVISSVRGASISTLSHCLKQITHVPRSDYNLFLEYILPSLHMIPSDSDVMVRVAFAECVADLALTAHRFLELAQVQSSQDDETSIIHYQVQGSYDSELMQLQESFQAMIVHLLSDADSSVKKSFLKLSAGKLCVFFGPHRAKEVILSHMITFLNDKSDWELHGAFFEAIVPVVIQLRHHSLAILEPLLQQGLSDCEESVVSKTIEAMTKLCLEGIFDQQLLIDHVMNIAPFLIHPNMWLRYRAVGYLVSVSSVLSNVNTECYLLPIVQKYLCQRVTHVSSTILLCLSVESIPRGVFDYLIKQQNIVEIFDCLIERQAARLICSYNEEPRYITIAGNLIPTFRKLQSLGLNEKHENSLIFLKDHMLKQHMSKKQFPDHDGRYTAVRGVLDTRKLPGCPVPRHHKLIDGDPLAPRSQVLTPNKMKMTSQTKLAGASTTEVDPSVNEEWDRLFGSPSDAFNIETTKIPKPDITSKTTVSTNGAVGNPLSCSSDTTLLSQTAVSGKSAILSSWNKAHKRSHSDGSLFSVDEDLMARENSFDNSIVKVEYASCRENLSNLLHYKQQQYSEDFRSMDDTRVKKACHHISTGWMPKGQLIAHIHEHKLSINRLSVLTGSTMFASFSDDGTTKVWDVQKLEGRNVVNKAKLSYNQQGGKIKAGLFCRGNRSVAAGSTAGSVHVFDLENKKAGGKKQLVFEKYISGIVDMGNLASSGGEVLVLATNTCGVVGLDLRANKIVWDFKRHSRYGVPLCLAVDPFENWLAIGTSLGYHVIWDVRFQLPVSSWQHSGHAGKGHVHHIHRVSPHPTQPSSLVAAVSGNNEVSVWDMETATRRQMLWASPAQPFSEMRNSAGQNESVRALTTCLIDNNPAVLTGGTDCIIRLWNLTEPSLSSCFLSPGSRKIHHKDFKSRIIEGVDVVQEICSSEVQQSPSLEQHGHVDFITDIGLISHKNQHFITTSSNDGVLKIWK